MTKIKANISLIQNWIEIIMAQYNMLTLIQIQTYHQINQLWMPHIIDMTILPKLIKLKITVLIVINKIDPLSLKIWT